ncbi:MAG: hypothetical protein ACR2NF_04760, partial [Pirellulales bacterium]
MTTNDHERPHLTKYDHIKNNGERKVALLLGELLSPRSYFLSRYLRGFMPKVVGMKVGKSGSKAANQTLSKTPFSCSKTIP